MLDISIQNWRLYAIIVLTVMPLFAASGSGVWNKAGASKIGPHSEEWDKRTATYVYDHYFIRRSTGWADSVIRANFIDADFVFQSDIAPAVTAGYEHSFNRVLSVSAGLGIRFASSTYSLEQGSAYEYNRNMKLSRWTATIFYDSGYFDKSCA
ncbi:MAG: hypothetical protein ACLFSB_16425 [Chitinispirillaceae bacterium]